MVSVRDGRVECGVSTSDFWCLLDISHSSGCIPRKDETVTHEKAPVDFEAEREEYIRTHPITD